MTNEKQLPRALWFSFVILTFVILTFSDVFSLPI